MAHFCVGGTDGTFLVVSGDYVDLTEDETIVCVCVFGCVCGWVSVCVCVCGCVSMGESVGVYAFVWGACLWVCLSSLKLRDYKHFCI
jgi:hypothetical protein